MPATKVLQMGNGITVKTKAVKTRRPWRRKRHGVLVVAALALAGCGSGSVTSTTSSTPTSPPRATPVGVTASQLHAVASSAGHPIFWAGTSNGTYELTTIADGRTYIRYLPPGVPVGSSTKYLTIGTYALSSSPYNSVHNAALGKHALIKTIGKTGELAVQYHSRPQSVYLVFPGAKYEVEVYDPSASTALHLATTSQVVPIP